MKTIVEFVETEAIMGTLQQLGVDYAQGYALGKPKSFAKLISAEGESTI